MSGSVSIRVEFYSQMQKTFGEKMARVSLNRPARVIDALEMVCTTHERKEKVFQRQGKLRQGVTVMRNGRNIAFLDGLMTELNDGDELAIFPIVCGG